MDDYQFIELTFSDGKKCIVNTKHIIAVDKYLGNVCVTISGVNHNLEPVINPSYQELRDILIPDKEE